MDDWDRFFLSVSVFVFDCSQRNACIQTVASLSPPVMEWFNFMLLIEILS